MAAVAALKRLLMVSNSGIGGFGAASKKFSGIRFSHTMKHDGESLFVLDTQALASKLEGAGMPKNHAESITSAIVDGLNESMENVSQTTATKLDTITTELLYDTKLLRWKGEMESSQEYRFYQHQHKIEKLKFDLEQVGRELRHDMDETFNSLKIKLEETKFTVFKIKICMGLFISAAGLSLACGLE